MTKMPCYDSRDPKQFHNAQVAHLKDHIVNLEQRNDKLVRLLCELCNDVEGIPGAHFSPELTYWWEKHKELDIERGFRI